jgi:hypothetical protein
MTPPVPPEDDIGPFYKVLALFLTLVAGGLLMLNAWRDRASTWTDVGMVGVIGCFVFALVRPKWFDSFAKTIADKIPFVAFKKNGSGS